MTAAANATITRIGARLGRRELMLGFISKFLLGIEGNGIESRSLILSSSHGGLSFLRALSDLAEHVATTHAAGGDGYPDRQEPYNRDHPISNDIFTRNTVYMIITRMGTRQLRRHACHEKTATYSNASATV
jgi:hypothetical protein